MGVEAQKGDRDSFKHTGTILPENDKSTKLTKVSQTDNL